jgi:hypothetical protein
VIDFVGTGLGWEYTMVDSGSRTQTSTLVVQDETPPYRYVSVEGLVVEKREAECERDLRPLAQRYLGPEKGDAYITSYKDATFGHVYVMVPRRWLANDHRKIDR